MQSTYEDLKAKYETEETPESHLLHVFIPQGFTREQVGAKVEYDFGRVRVFGERPLENNRKGRFNTLYQVPEYCDINRIRGKFEGINVTITMPKIPEKVPKQEPQPTEQEVQKSPPKKEEPKQENDDKSIPPQSATTIDDQKTTTSNDQVPESKSESEKEVGREISTPPKTTEEEPMPQKATMTKVESKKQVGQETSTSPKGQENVESREQVGHEASTIQKDTKEFVPQKGQENALQKAITTKDAKLQTKESARETDENEERKREIGKEEIKDHPKNVLESRNTLEKAMVDGPTKENQEMDKGSTKVETFSTKGIQKEREKELNGKNGNDHDDGEKNDKKGEPESITMTRIKKVADSASQAMTSLAKRFNEEDKQRLIYMGATVLVVALGVYATYKLRASRRP